MTSSSPPLPPSSTPRITLPPTFSTPLPPNLRSAINVALLSSNSIPKIQAALLHECQAAGFTASLRARTLELLRSGECTSYGEVMERILGEIGFGGKDGEKEKEGKEKEKEKEVNGERVRLKIPGRVIEEGVRVVRGAVEGVVEVGGGGEGE